ncbi:MAG TPA: DUF5719 family protein [Acidimicrobiales bacterium]|nr:DUF5719 family protein [Acidimicrobiales bacterium]
MSTFFRRLLVVIAVGAFVVAGVVFSRDRPARVAATYGSNDQPPMPIARIGAALTTSWFCPGVPAAADRSTGDGSVTVLNPTDTPMTGSITYFPGEAPAITGALTVAPHNQAVVVPRDSAAAPFTGVLIEVYGTNAVVAEAASTSLGWSSTPCSTTASSSWYLAEGATTIDAKYQLLVMNPFPDDAIVDFSFVGDDGGHAPGALQGFVVKARSLRVVDVDKAMQRDALVSTTVQARNGRVVVGRFQSLPGPSRKGLVMTLGAPSAGSQWWFADGKKADGVNERVILYNPRDDDSSVDVTVFPADPTAGSPVPLKYTVPAHQRVEVGISASQDVPAGMHSIVVGTEPDQPIVAERVLDLTGKSRTASTVQLGGRTAAERWFIPVAAPVNASNVLTVVNVTGVDANLSVSALGTAGETPVADLQDVLLPAGAATQVALQDHGVGNQPVVVTANGQVVVEQFVTPGGTSPGAASALGIPVASR